MSYLFFSCTTIFFSLFLTLFSPIYAAQNWCFSEANHNQTKEKKYSPSRKKYSLQEINRTITDCLPKHMPTTVKKIIQELAEDSWIDTNVEIPIPLDSFYPVAPPKASKTKLTILTQLSYLGNK